LIYELFLEKFIDRTKQLSVGNVMSEKTDVGPMITEEEAKRVESLVLDAVTQGAKVQLGGKRDGAFY